MATKSATPNLLSPQVRHVLSNLSQRVFYQEPKSNGLLSKEQPGSEFTTSIVMQMSMFFNICFFPFWVTANALMLNIKYEYLDSTYRVLLIAVLVIFAVVEVIRLYLGYVGNLQGKAPELFGFLLLTILPQFPLVLFLLFNDNAIVMPLERAVDSVLSIIILIEIISAWSAGRSISRQQATNFHLRQFIDLEQIQDHHDFIDPNAPRVIQRATYRA